MGMKNDASFLLHWTMNLWAHQSTFNPNMPVKPLSEYAWFIDRIRSLTSDHEIEEAVDTSIDEMPDDYLLKTFLIGNRAEVKDMCITEYDEVATMQQFKEEGREEGRAEGLEEGREKGRVEGEDKLAKLVNALISAGRIDDVSKATSDTTARTKFYTEFNIA